MNPKTKITAWLLGIISFFGSCKTQKEHFEHYPAYEGNDLGLTYGRQASFFRVWSPKAKLVRLSLYEQGTGGVPISTLDMVKSEHGTWSITVPGDLEGKFYTFSALHNDKKNGSSAWSLEVPDPYARAVGVNGMRAMVIDLKKTNPPGWDIDSGPVLQSANEAVIYELHIRDASISPSAGITHKGKYQGLTETGTKNNAGLATGLDHIEELGVTHVHLLPVFDFRSLDENRHDQAQYNWGYDPLNYNSPDGFYASDPHDGSIRVREFKQLIQSFHRKNIGVIMDVVYNHTGLTETSSFNQLVPGYYYRQNADGNFSNASACGNETASERPMFRKFMIESMKYWMEEYHIDGFRVDLMGIHDIETMNQIARELKKIKSDVLIYGEGWTAGPSPLPDSVRAIKANAAKLNQIAVFSDEIRDAIKGHVFTETEKGFVSGNQKSAESLKFGLAGGCSHPQINFHQVNYTQQPYVSSPAQTIVYADCHDNHILWDKLALSAPEYAEQIRKDMHLLALTIVLTSQGIPFLHAGTEFLRSKKGVENSFESPDSINAIDWNLKTKHADAAGFVQQLINLRKQHPAFRMTNCTSIGKYLQFIEGPNKGVLGLKIKGSAAGDSWSDITVWYNGTNEKQLVETGYPIFHTAVRDNKFISTTLTASKIELSPFSSSIIYTK